AVAVVVEAVAHLSRRRARRAGLRCSADAVLHGALADAGAAGRASQALVDLAVAVVVDAVADLGCRRAWRAGLCRAADAVLHRALARAHAARRRAQPFVGAAVAVVVEAVAALRRGRHLHHARAPRAVAAGLRAGVTLADAG